MNILGLDKAMEIIKQNVSNFNLEENTYLLKTKDAYLTLSLDEDNEHPEDKKLSVKVTGGNIVVIETDERPFSDMFSNSEVN
ncbi:hypothetical protein [Macrococcoides goetzii]|nr:hypothetical protein [Macrococcus goetzii]